MNEVIKIRPDPSLLLLWEKDVRTYSLGTWARKGHRRTQPEGRCPQGSSRACPHSKLVRYLTLDFNHQDCKKEISRLSHLNFAVSLWLMEETISVSLSKSFDASKSSFH